MVFPAVTVAEVEFTVTEVTVVAVTPPVPPAELPPPQPEGATVSATTSKAMKLVLNLITSISPFTVLEASVARDFAESALPG